MPSAMHLLSVFAQFALIGAIAFGIFVLVTSHLRFQDLFKESAVLARSGPSGLLEAQLAERLGTAHRETRPFSLLLLKAQQWDQMKADADRTTLSAFMRQRIAHVMRRTDTLVEFGADRFAIVVDVPLASMPAVVARINDDLRKEVFRPVEGQPFRVAISAGVSACPEDGHRVQLLRESAEAALVTSLAQASTVQYSSNPPAVAPHTHAQPEVASETEAENSGLIDELTGVLHERHLESALQKYVARYRNEEFPVSVICLDIDYMRRYNEQYGSKIGDAILKQLGLYLQGALREADLIARCDGDQFVVVLSATPQEALGVAQRLGTAIKRLPFQTTGSPLKVAVSGGVAGYPDHGGGGRALFHFANAALRVAKSRGRSTMVLYHFSMHTPEQTMERADVF